MYHYVYKVEDPITKEYYIGSRSCKCLPSEDTMYKGSTKTWIPNNYDLLEKEIIQEDFINREDALIFESTLIEKHIKDTLNRNYAQPGPKFHTVGKDCSGELNGFHNKNHDKATKLKIGRSGNLNAAFGKKWIHKDGQRKFVKKDNLTSYIEDGWTLGNLTSGKAFTEKRIWITDGSFNKYIKEGELNLADGWKIGKTYTAEGLSKIKESFRNIDRTKNIKAIKDSTSNTVWMNDGLRNHRIKLFNVEEYKTKGFNMGRLNYEPWNKGLPRVSGAGRQPKEPVYAKAIIDAWDSIEK
jgi:hypothetical protein